MTAVAGTGIRAAQVVAIALTAAIPLIGVAWLLNLPVRMGHSIVTASYLSVMIGIATAAAFLLYPFRSRAGWLELVVAAVALAAWGWGAWHHEDWLVHFGRRPPEQYGPAIVALILMIEGLRRACGLSITLVVLAFAAYPFVGHHFGGEFNAPFVRPERVLMYFYADTNGVPGLVLGVASSVVLGFILLGAAMNAVGASRFFTDMAMAAMGPYRGGPAKVSVVSSTLFGMISGSTVGNVMTSGVVTIPLMKRSGVRPHNAAAIEAVASNGGQLAPPVMGATAFLIAEFLQVPYSSIVAAALIPAVIYYLILFLQVDIIARSDGLTGMARADLPRVGATIVAGWFYLLPIGLLIWMLFGLGREAGNAALHAAGLMVVLGLLMRLRSIGIGPFLSILTDAGRTMTTLLLICGAAGVVIGSLNLTGVGFLLTNSLAGIGATYGLVAMLVVTAIIAIFLGMGMPTAAVYVVLSIILVPALVRMGVEPMAAHLFIFYFGLLSMLTPPVAVASYTAAALAQSGPWATGLAGLRLGAGAFLLPILFALNPALIAQGSALEITLAVITVVAGSYLLALALAEGGRVITRAPIERALLLAAALVTATATLWAGTDSLLALLPAAGTLVFALGLIPIGRSARTDRGPDHRN
ncbi:MAG: TRAP transporter fused permease subunit [Rhodobacteraceae bacterium]|nr:TRAP transporter fused permease subunit [Paracoccaceae bacterium]